MVQLTVITVGTLKESYWRDAVAEYEKRLSGFAKVNLLQLKEQKLPDHPSENEIRNCLSEEGKQILAAIPPKSYRIALCVEGQPFSSEEFSDKLGQILQSNGSISLIIGSSFGLSDQVKAEADLRLSVSEMTFPHQLMRVMLLEILYRSFSILKGTHYHK